MGFPARHRRLGVRGWLILGALLVQGLLPTAAWAAAAPVITSFTPASGAVGALITIKGDHFTGATDVTFRYVSASFTFVTDPYYG